MKSHKELSTKCLKSLFITPTNNPKLGQGPITNLIIKILKNNIKRSQPFTSPKIGSKYN